METNICGAAAEMCLQATVLNVGCLQWTPTAVALLLKCVLEATVLNVGCMQWTPTAVALLLKCVLEATVLNVGCRQWTPTAVALLLKCFGGDRFECGLSAVDTNSCGAAAEMCFGGDRFECGLSAVDTNSCGASNLYLEATGSHLGRDTCWLLMLFVPSRFCAGKYGAVHHIIHYGCLLPLPF